MGDRGVSAVVGKALEAGIVVLYIGLLVTTLHAGVVPEYRTAGASEIADRSIAGAHTDIRTAVPATATGETTKTVEIPDRIRGEPYEIRVEEAELVLDHPHETLEERTPLIVPSSVVSVDGQAQSDRQPHVVVTPVDDGVEVKIEEEDK